MLSGSFLGQPACQGPLNTLLSFKSLCPIIHVCDKAPFSLRTQVHAGSMVSPVDWMGSPLSAFLGLLSEESSPSGVPDPFGATDKRFCQEAAILRFDKKEE